MKYHPLTEKVSNGLWKSNQDLDKDNIDKTIRQYLGEKADKWHSEPCNLEELLDLTSEETLQEKFKKHFADPNRFTKEWWDMLANLAEEHFKKEQTDG